MNGFFTNLLNRHRGTCNIIRPRTLSRFEEDHGRGMPVSPDEDINAVVSAVELPNVTIHEPGLHESDRIGSEKDDSSSSHLEQGHPSTQPGLTEQQEVLSASDTLPMRANETHPFDEVQSDILPTTSPAAEHDLGNELNHRIRAILQHLVDDTESSVAEPALDDQGNRPYESQKSISSEKKTPLLNTAILPFDSVHVSEPQTDSQNNISADGGRENIALYDPLEPPSWLSEIETRFNSQLKDKETKTEPVINVTIGRVEVRAVQTDSAKKANRTKKPTGVMPLEEYRKIRKGTRAR